MQKIHIPLFLSPPLCFFFKYLDKNLWPVLLFHHPLWIVRRWGAVVVSKMSLDAASWTWARQIHRTLGGSADKNCSCCPHFRFCIYTLNWRSWTSRRVFPTGNTWRAGSSVSVTQIHIRLNTGIDFRAAGFDGKRTWCPISWTSVSILPRPNCYSRSHADTQTRTYFQICVAENARERREKRHLWRVSTAQVCVPVICTISGCNIILVYREILVLNVWKLISFDLILNVGFISITVDFYSASLKDFKGMAGMFIDSCGVLFIAFYCQLTTELATRS